MSAVLNAPLGASVIASHDGLGPSLDPDRGAHEPRQRHPAPLSPEVCTMSRDRWELCPETRHSRLRDLPQSQAHLDHTWSSGRRNQPKTRKGVRMTFWLRASRCLWYGSMPCAEVVEPYRMPSVMEV